VRLTRGRWLFRFALKTRTVRLVSISIAVVPLCVIIEVPVQLLQCATECFPSLKGQIWHPGRQVRPSACPVGDASSHVVYLRANLGF
jgi:hypothetical protein